MGGKVVGQTIARADTCSANAVHDVRAGHDGVTAVSCQRSAVSKNVWRSSKMTNGKADNH